MEHTLATIKESLKFIRDTKKPVGCTGFFNSYTGKKADTSTHEKIKELNATKEEIAKLAECRVATVYRVLKGGLKQKY